MDIFQKAKENANKSQMKNKHGAIIYDRDRVYATGYNKMILFLNLRKYGYERASLHAEADALIKLRYRTKHMTLLVLRLGKTKLRNSKPCKGCLAMCKEVGIEKVIFSNQFGNFEEMWIGD